MNCPNCGTDVPSKTEAVMRGLFWIVAVIAAVAFPVVMVLVKQG